MRTNESFMSSCALGEETNPREAGALKSQLARVYRQAFAGEPWYEVSKCVGTEVQSEASADCVGSFSALEAGQSCTSCRGCPDKIAYTEKELDSKFEAIGRKSGAVYTERADSGSIVVAGIAYLATAETIALEKYSDVPGMEDWLGNALGERTLWLDEVFADRQARSEGNLSNFVAMVEGVAAMANDEVELPTTVAFRTISPAMIAAARRFGDRTTVFAREADVPDRRDFVTIELESRR
jgi:hypothetical protein